MSRIKIEKEVSVPRERVIRYFSNPSLYFKVHAKHYLSYEILPQIKDGEIDVREEWQFGNNKISFVHRIVSYLPNHIDLEIIEGFGKGSKEIITFEELARGTKVIYKSDFRFGGIIGIVLNILAKQKMRKLLEEMTEEDCRYIEQNL